MYIYNIRSIFKVSLFHYLINRLDIKLKWPFCRILAVAKYNFSPTESNQLPLKEGCTLKILSKEGDQKGWWKGQIGDKVIQLNLLYKYKQFLKKLKYI